MNETATLVLSNGTNQIDLMTFGEGGEPCPEQTAWVVGLHVQRALGEMGTIRIKTDTGSTQATPSDGTLAGAYAQLLVDLEKWIISQHKPSKIVTAIHHLNGVAGPTVDRHLLEMARYAVDTRQETYHMALGRLLGLHQAVADAANMAVEWLREQEAPRGDVQ